MTSTGVGVTLAQCRKRRYLTQEGLATAAGVSFATVKSIEAGRVKSPRLRVVKHLAEALDVDPATVEEFRVALGLTS